MTVEKIMEKCFLSLDHIAKNREKYVVNPEKDFTRERILTLRELIYIMFSMEAGTLNSELRKHFPVCNKSFTSSAFIQQRQKIKANALEDIFHMTNKIDLENRTWKGYNLYAVDGSDINISRNPNTESFIVSDKQHPKGYNLLLLVACFDLLNKTYSAAKIMPIHKSDERRALYGILKSNNFGNKSIVIVDRGYESYNTFAHFFDTPDVDFICRGRLNNPLLIYKRHVPVEDEEFDIDVEDEITTSQTNEDKENHRIFIQTGSKKGKINSSKTTISTWDFHSPYKMKLRAVKIKLDNGKYELLYTSLSRDVASLEDLKMLYKMRWGIETSFRKLKHTIGLARLHTRKEELIPQEVFAALTMYNIGERIVSLVVLKEKKEKKYQYKVNFTEAFKIIKEMFIKRALNNDVIKMIARYICPVRSGRNFARNNTTHKGFVGFVYRLAA